MDLDDLIAASSGTWTRNAELGSRTWFRAGGRADFLFEPADSNDLAFFLKNCGESIPILTIGFGSNMLIRDGGVRGVAILLGKSFAGAEVKGARIDAGVSVPARALAQKAQHQNLSGFEFMRGIPGSIGGCVAMNAGAYGCQTADVFIQAHALDRHGAEHVLGKEDMAFSYRQSISGGQFIFTKAIFEGRQGDAAEIQALMDKINAARQQSQPPGARTGGSTFKNPQKEASGKKAWQLIEQAGCRNLSHGDAYVCQKHCNFLVNGGRASAADIEALGEDIRQRVAAQTGIMLEWEIQRVGEAG